VTTAAPAAQLTALPPVSPVVKFGRLLASEWIKLRTMRSTVWSLIVLVVVSIGLTALFAVLVTKTWTGAHNGSRNASIVADPVSNLLGTGINLGQLAICVLGVLFITAEYSSSVIKLSLLVTPRRLPMLAAKATVLAAVIVVVGEIVSFGAFLAGSAILHDRVRVSLGDPGVARAVVGTGLALGVLSLFALSIGVIIRHTAGAITTVIGVVLVLPIITGQLPGSWGAHINAYLPEQAGGLMAQAHRHSGDLLTAWQGFGIFCLWTAALLVLASFLLSRRDA
jgi:hypothetical protein